MGIQIIYTFQARFWRWGRGKLFPKKKLKWRKHLSMGGGGGLLACTYTSIFNFTVNFYFFYFHILHKKWGHLHYHFLFYILFWEKGLLQTKWRLGLPLSLILRASLLNAYTKSPHRPQMTYWQSQITFSHWNYYWNTRT